MDKGIMKAPRGKSNSNKSAPGALRPQVTSEPSSLTDHLLDGFLRPYQRRWAKDPARLAIAVKSAQIGYSTATAGWAVKRCLEIPQRNVIFLSRSERQALELGEKAKIWVD